MKSGDLDKRILESEERFRTLVECAPDAILVESEGNLVYLNPAGAKLLGAASPEQLAGKPLADFVHTDGPAPVKQQMQQGEAADWPTDRFEQKWVRLDRQAIDVEVRAIPINWSGRPAMQLVCKDVTDRKRAEQALLESETRLRSIINCFSDFVYFKDGAGRWLEANDLALQLFQLEGVSYSGKTSAELAGCSGMHEKFLLECDGSDELAWKSGRQVGMERRIVLPDGTLKLFDVSKVPIFHTNGSRNGLVVIGRDITEHKRTERILQDKRERYKSLFEHNPDIVCSFDLEGNFVSVNPAVEHITGYRPQDLLGRTAKIVIVPEDFARAKEHFAKAAQGEPQNFELAIIHKNGNCVDLNITYVPIVVHGDIVGVYAIAKDVTERKRVERALTEAEAMYRSLVEEAMIGVYIYQDGRFVYVNPRMAEIFGYTQEEMLQMDVLDLFAPEDQPLVARNIRRRMSGEVQSLRYQVRAVGKNGTQIDLEVHGALTVYNGRPAITGTYLDISERKQTEELLRESDKLAAVGQLAAGVAHEIRNPLTALKGFLQLLKTKTDANQDYFDIMLSELERINLIVNEFLVLAKPQVIHFEPKDVRLLLQNVIALLDTQAILNNVQIFTQFADDLPLVNCAENQLKQVFINILKNGIEAMPGGGHIEIQVKRRGRDQILIRFADQGCGIPEDRLSKLGEPFYTTKEKGTGLGLMVSHKIIEAHRGKISINSLVGKGTRVDVILPAAVGGSPR
ncbi:PAS domain S-box protein [Effusibacillus pohliae]|uniref:PAS domain S-box protein n=1 Tax=Effusibacillus pohliae TaxID=232270 RepID=UPI00037C561F|nr:PAS domain S-box protein [Effusibacillus pohliae]